MNSRILKLISKTFMKDLANDIINVQPMNNKMGKIFNMLTSVQIFIYSDIKTYNDVDAFPDNIIKFKAKRDNVTRMITETAVECKINIEMQKTAFNTWRVLSKDDIFQSTFKLKYG